MNLKEIRKYYKELKNTGEIQGLYRNKYKKKQEKKDGNIINYKVAKHSKGLKSEDIKDLIEQNKNALRLKLLSKSDELNKGKKVALKKFINQYLSKLSILEEQELLSKIYYYLDVYEQYSFGGSDKLDDEILLNRHLYSKAEIIYELLFYNLILPEYTNQKDFNLKMKDFISRLENSISGFRENDLPIYFPSINPARIWNYMEEMSIYSISGSKKISKGLIKNISYRFHLGQKVDVNELNEFSFSFLIEDEILSRNEFIRYLEEILKLKKISDKEFIYGSDSNFRFSIYVQDNYYLDYGYKSLEEYQNEKTEPKSIGFEVKIYSESKKDLSPEEELSNACHSFPVLMETILNDIYKTYKDDTYNIYPERKEIFDLVNYINFNENIGDNIVSSDEMGFIGLSSPSNFLSKNTDKKDELEIKKIGLDDLILNEKIKKELSGLIKKYKNRDFYLKHGGDLPTGILLYGLSGGGKTTIAKILANESNSGFFIVEANIQGKYVGESENNLKQRIDSAKKHIDETGENAIIFIDEAENLFSARGKENHKEGMLALLLIEMDGVDEKYKGKITYILATNRKDILDPALLSRIDKNLEIPMPNVSELEKIIDLNIKEKMKICKDVMYEKADIDIPKIAKKIKGKSGRFVMKLIKNAHNRGLDQYIDDKEFVMSTEFILDSIEFTEVEEQKEKEKTMGFKI